MMRSLPVDSQAIRTYDREGSRSKSPDYYNRHLENTQPLKASPSSSAFHQTGYGARGDHRQVLNDNSTLLKSEIDMLNKRLDKIDRHCMEFTKMATEKAKLEDNLKNLAYLHMLEAEQTGKVSKPQPYDAYREKKDDHDRSLTRNPTFNPNLTGSDRRDQQLPRNESQE